MFQGMMAALDSGKRAHDMAEFKVSNANSRFTLRLTVTETETSTPNNSSECSYSLDLIANTSYHFSNYAIGFSVSLDGAVVKSQARSANNQYSIASYGSINLCSGSVTVKHSDDGSKTLPVAFSIDMQSKDFTAGALSGTGSMPLTKIARRSTLTIGNGTLGVLQQLKITKQSDSFTHTITYKCGSLSGTICSASAATTIPWTPPLSLASQNTTGTTLSVVVTITTDGVGSYSTTIICTIPSSVKPSVVLSVSDAAGYFDTYGAYILGRSRLSIKATPTPAYGSAIKSYLIIADGKAYTTDAVTTEVLQNSGNQKITAKVTDQRNYSSNEVSFPYTVYPYSVPSITINAYRCNSSGAVDEEGAYMKIIASAVIAGLGGKNSAQYIIRYKKETDSSWTTVSGSGTSYTSGIIDCDSSVAWNIEATFTDAIDENTKAATVPPAFSLVDYYKTGKGIAFGQIATRDGFDCNLDAHFFKNVRGPVLGLRGTTSTMGENGDFNDYLTPGVYSAGDNKIYSTLKNKPPSVGTGTLRVWTATGSTKLTGAWTYIMQEFRPASASDTYYWRICKTDANGVWSFGEWSCDLFPTMLYEGATIQMGNVTLNDSVSNYRFVDIFYGDNGGGINGCTRISTEGKFFSIDIMQANAGSVYMLTSQYRVDNGKTLTRLYSQKTVFEGTAVSTTSVTGSEAFGIRKVVGYR